MYTTEFGFIKPKRQYRNKVADAFMTFTNGPLNGFKLIGFQIFEDLDTGELTVSMPCHYNQKDDKGNTIPFYYLRANQNDLDLFQDALLDAYEKWEDAQDSSSMEASGLRAAGH